jgi:HlyD family secretion protein
MNLKGKFTTHALVGISILVLLAAALWSGRFLFDFGKNLPGLSVVVPVTTRSFSLTVTERGVVSPAQISPVSSQISSNQGKIVWLVKEGTNVRRGMLVARFDTKPFVDSMQKAEQAYADSQASFLVSQKLLSLQEEEEQGKIEEAERQLEIAKIKANNITNGSGPLQRKVFEQKLHQAERALELSRDELEDLDMLLEKGHVSKRERDKALDKLSTALEQVQVAQAEVDNFNSYAWPQMQREAELLVNGAESNLLRVKRTAELLIQNRAAEVEKNRRKVENKGKTLLLSKADVANCDIYAPTDGILLYSELPRNNGRRKIQIGDSVWVGQTFLEVPDTSELIAEIQIREVDVAKIQVGMKTAIEVDAFPGKTFEGRVESVASLAKEDDDNANIRRFYGRIQFLGDLENIHVGMSVTTRITYKEVREVIAVPISSVFFDDGQARVRIQHADNDQVIPVVLGERGQMWVEVRSGLNIGDLVYAEGQ